MFRFLFLALLVAFFGAADAFAPGVNAAAAVRSAPVVTMSTQYTVAAGVAKKKNPKTGDTINLKGYKVGDRAPDVAKNSGTTKGEQSAWNQVFGGIFGKKK